MGRAAHALRGGLAIACLGRRGSVHAAVLAHVGWNVLVAARPLPVALRAWHGGYRAGAIEASCNTAIGPFSWC